MHKHIVRVSKRVKMQKKKKKKKKKKNESSRRAPVVGYHFIILMYLDLCKMEIDITENNLNRLIHSDFGNLS